MHGGTKETFGNSRAGGGGGGGGGIFLHKNGNSGKVGVLAEIPSMVGVWIFSGTKQCNLDPVHSH